MKLKFLFCILFFSTTLLAQKGTISGTLTDKDMNNEPLPFANVQLKGTSVGTTSDENGNFSLNVEPGNHTLQLSFLGYETIEVPVTIKENQTVTINRALTAGGGVMLQDVIVQTTVSREKESALLLEQQKAVEIKQSIGAQELSRKGVGDVAAAVAKTTGVSKQEGSGNVYVRGLGDRYNSTSMNGLPVPSNDPEKKNINLELFSTDIVEYISIDKVYNTKVYGDFGGGNVDISSKDYRGKGMFEITIGAKANTNAIEKDGEFLLNDGPNFSGFTSTEIPNNPLNSFGYENKLAPVSKTPYGGNIGVKAGKSFNFGEEGRLNLFATASFDNGYEFREGINQTVSAQGARLKSFNQEKFTYKTNSTGMFNANYRINLKHSIKYNFLYVNSSEQSRDSYFGYDRDYEEEDNLLVRRGNYVQNTVMINQLLGNHKLTEKLSLDWGTSFNKIESDMPDRTQNKMWREDEANDGFVLAQRTTTDNHRYFQNLVEEEAALNLALNYKLGVNDLGESKGKITLGYNGRFKNRDFEAIQFNFRITEEQLTQFYNPDNLDAFFNQQNLQNGFFTISSFAGLTPQTYSGEQNIHAGFGNLEYRFSDKFSSIIGLRFEKIDQTVKWRTQLDAGGDSNTFNRNEFLPSVILKYSLNEKQNLRMGLSKTYTLPQFKERALFIYEDVTEIKIGNPDLYPSQNYNLDLKWEMFPKSEELISFTVFGKYIVDPINEVNLASSTNDISFVNIGDSGYVYGAEVEARKNIINIEGEKTNKLSAGINISYMKTSQELDGDKVRNETNGRLNLNLTDETSGFTGASDLLLNADLSYAKDWKNDMGIMATVAYSYYSDRLYALGIEQKGNLVDKGMGTLDFIFKSKLSQKLGVDFTVRNILNPEFVRVQENSSGYVDAMTYKKGIVFGLGINYSF
ncbi:TonB-dependent receptor domain-containing protein [Flavobacterium sp.]|uniref:TonB-dependent receptor n=1 Tax=Flavobacterium sp. TaxID=239 RepID=UPI003527EDF9